MGHLYMRLAGEEYIGGVSSEWDELMRYIKVKWIHSYPDEPVLLYSEIDDSGWEVRKVEVFPDGAYGYANASSRLYAEGC